MHITVHIIESPGIRSLGADRVSVPVGIVVKPGVGIGLHLIRIIPKRIRRGSPRTVGIFPFRFGRQAIHIAAGQTLGGTFLRSELSAVVGGVPPKDPFDRQITGTGMTTGIASHHGQVFRLRDLISAEPETLGNDRLG
jgi:hypothetical protein